MHLWRKIGINENVKLGMHENLNVIHLVIALTWFVCTPISWTALHFLALISLHDQLSSFMINIKSKHTSQPSLHAIQQPNNNVCEH